VDPFEFFVEGPPLSQQTRNPSRLRDWKAYVRAEAAKLWQAQAPLEIPLKLTVVYYHERQSVLIDHNYDQTDPGRSRRLKYMRMTVKSLTPKPEKQILTDDFVFGAYRLSTPAPSVAVGSSFKSE
jgi:hypothetical protein